MTDLWESLYIRSWLARQLGVPVTVTHEEVRACIERLEDSWSRSERKYRELMRSSASKQLVLHGWPCRIRPIICPMGRSHRP